MADRVNFGGESAHLAEGLLSDAYAGRVFALIEAGTALLGTGERYAAHLPKSALTPGSPKDFARECTTHLTLLIQTAWWFGNPDLGFGVWQRFHGWRHGRY